MTTVINNPGDNGSGGGWVVAVIVVIILLAVFFIYGLPAIQKSTPNNGGGAQINVQLPSGGDSGAGSASGGSSAQ